MAKKKGYGTDVGFEFSIWKNAVGVGPSGTGGPMAT